MSCGSLDRESSTLGVRVWQSLVLDDCQTLTTRLKIALFTGHAIVRFYKSVHMISIIKILYSIQFSVFVPDLFFVLTCVSLVTQTFPVFTVKHQQRTNMINKRIFVGQENVLNFCSCCHSKQSLNIHISCCVIPVF